MKQGSFFSAGWWPFVVFPLLLLLPLLFFKWHTIEQDVAHNAKSKLRSLGANWAEVETYNLGRDILLTGTAPSQEALAQAERSALSSEGVRVVNIDATQIAPTHPKLNSIVTGDSIVLRGTVANQASIDALMAQAAASFGAGKVLNKLSVGENTAELPILDGLFSALSIDGNLGTLTAELENDTMTLSGEVLGDNVKTTLNSQLTRIFGSFKDQLIVAKPVQRDVCQNLVNELLASGKINFQSAEATIKEDSFALLRRIGNTAKRCPDASFEVAGHTDSVGNLNFNMALSGKRAQAVVDHLVGLGLSTKQFIAAGYGPNQPIQDNATSAGRAENRRIELRLKN
ncbi:MAG: outer membrane protein OmpA-like peptidoglycan-associated protein [Cryomorphaceae bacterium]